MQNTNYPTPWRKLERGGDKKIHPAIFDANNSIVAIFKLGSDEVVDQIVAAVNLVAQAQQRAAGAA
jgi:hypothetical protein